MMKFLQDFCVQNTSFQPPKTQDAAKKRRRHHRKSSKQDLRPESLTSLFSLVAERFATCLGLSCTAYSSFYVKIQSVKYS